MFPYQQNVISMYGAQMGRSSDPIGDLKGRIHLRRVPMVDYCYDQGGAYWGMGPPALYCAWDNEGRVHYFRAHSREHAKALLSGKKFYR